MNWWEWLSELQVLEFYELRQQFVSPCLALLGLHFPVFKTFPTFLQECLWSYFPPKFHMFCRFLGECFLVLCFLYSIVILCIWFTFYISVRYLTFLERRESKGSREEKLSIQSVSRVHNWRLNFPLKFLGWLVENRNNQRIRKISFTQTRKEPNLSRDF